MRGLEPLEFFVGKILAIRDAGRKAEHSREDLTQRRKAIGLEEALKFGQVSELVGLLEQQTADVVFDGGPVLGFDGVFQGGVGSGGIRNTPSANGSATA